MLRSRLWRKLVPIITALTLLLSMATVAAADEPVDAAALAERLNSSKNTAKAWQALSAEEQAAVNDYLAVATFTEEDSGVTPVASRSGAKIDGMVMLAATNCWTFTKTLNAKNFFGMTMWAYKLRIDWCGNGSTVTDVLRTQRTGHVYHAYWSWNHIDSATSGGRGKTWYWYFTQAEFRYCPVGQGCINHRYPYVEMTVRPNGTLSGAMGG